MTPYQFCVSLKFIGVLGFVGGLFAAFFAAETEARKVAVHRIASPSLLMVWGAGYAACAQVGVALTELWVLTGLVLPLLALVLTLFSTARERPPALAQWLVALCVLLTVVVMVTRPTLSGMHRP
jgi:hypothetical protein